MPPSDQEPRYQLVDSNGNVVGSFFGDGSGNVVIADETDTQTTFGPDGITTPALEAADSNGAVQVSQYNTTQDAIDAAGSGGTVVFDAAGAPHTVSGTPTWYDNQTVILRGEIQLDPSTSTILVDSGGSALEGLTLIPNGNLIDGQDRTGSAEHAVRLDDGSTECHVEGVLRVKRTSHTAIKFSNCNECSADVVVGEDIGDPPSNNNQGDIVNFGSAGDTRDCHVDTVICKGGISRHTVTFGSNIPERCSVQTVNSFKPGGAHVSFEAAFNCEVGVVIGRQGRNATNLSNPQTTYSNYPVLAFLASPNGGTVKTTINRAIIENPQGSGNTVEFANSCDNNEIKDLTAINPTGNAIEIGSGAGNANGNAIGVREISGAEIRGISFRVTNNSTVYGVGKGEIHDCQSHAVKFKDPENTLDGLVMYANGQDGSTNPAVFLDNPIQGTLITNCRIFDGGSGAQNTGIAYDSSITAARCRYVGNDLAESSNATNGDFFIGGSDAAAGNTPSL